MMAVTDDITTPVMISDDASLQALCAEWAQLPFLALDTEFIRVNTFFPKLGLLQVCDDRRSFLLDPLGIQDWDAFNALLQDQRIVKVLHSCSEDLVVFNCFFGAVPRPIFDTQRAAAYLGLGYSLSYQSLVKTMLAIDVPKGETRSDWLRRPLSPEQLVYAALDVAYLPEIYRRLQSALQERGRLQWLLDDCEQMRLVSTAAELEAGWDNYYRGLGAAWRLDEQQLGALRELCRWREVEARRRDKPRSWIARDPDLINIATAMPEDPAALRAVAELPSSLLRHDGETLLELVRRGRQHPASVDRFNRPLTQEQRRSLKRCQAAVRRVAARLEIAEELLGRKKQLIGLLMDHVEHGELRWPEDTEAWRREALHEELKAALQEKPST